MLIPTLIVLPIAKAVFYVCTSFALVLIALAYNKKT